MPRSMLVAVLCWGMTIGCLGDEAADTALAEETGEVEPDNAGQGMVIELDNSAPAGPGAESDVQTAPVPQELADSDVEMIIGGQGKDGIAKRGRLKRED